MQIIMPTVLFIGITNMLGIQILVPLDKENLVFYSVLAGAVVDMVINVACIPSMASAGAAFGTLVAEFVVLVVQVIMLQERIGQFVQSIQIGKILAAACLAVLASFWVKYLQLSSFFALAVSALLFFGVYGVVLYLLKECFVYDIMGQLRKRR